MSGVTLVGQLYPESRSTTRVKLERGATLRDANREPVDVLIEDLSSTGFGMSTVADLPIGSVVSLNLAGIINRQVRIVRRAGLAYGCEFLVPLSPADVTEALRNTTVVAGSFGRIGVEDEFDHDFPRRRKLSYLARAYVLFGSVIVLWSLIIFTIRVLLLS